MKFANLRQASWLLNDVVTIQRALSHLRRQGCFKHFFIPGDEAVKIEQVQFLDMA